MTLIDTFNKTVIDNVELFESILGDNYDVFKKIHHKISEIDSDNIIDLKGYIINSKLRIELILVSDEIVTGLTNKLSGNSDFSINFKENKVIFVSE